MLLADDAEMLVECVFMLLGVWVRELRTAAETSRMSSEKTSWVYEKWALLKSTGCLRCLCHQPCSTAGGKSRQSTLRWGMWTIAPAIMKERADVISARVAVPDYPPPPPFVPLNPATYTSHVPALLHAFFAARIAEANAHAHAAQTTANGSMLGTVPPPNAAPGTKAQLEDTGFDAAQSQIGPLGHVVTKETNGPPAKKKKVDDGAGGKIANGAAGKGVGGTGANGDGKVAPKKEKKKNP